MVSIVHLRTWVTCTHRVYVDSGEVVLGTHIPLSCHLPVEKHLLRLTIGLVLVALGLLLTTMLLALLWPAENLPIEVHLDSRVACLELS